MKNFIEKYGIAILVLIGLFCQGIFHLLHNVSMGNYIAIIVAIIALLPTIFKIISDIVAGSFGVDVIALVGIIASLLLGEYTAGLIILLMLSGGEVLERYALSKAQDGISHLIKENPTQANVIDGEKEYILPINEVMVGTLILVKQHELIPLDGIVIKGESLVDEAKITGESVPVKKTKDSLVMSGSINTGSPLYIQTTKRDTESTYQNIIYLVEKAQKIKPNFIRMADRYSVVFTIITFIMAFGAYFFTGEWINALLVLVVATPCPLILAAPTAFASGISMLAKYGVIVQNPDALERLSKAEVFLFDKTGTLTYGTPKVHKIEIFDSKYSEEELMKMLFSIEKFSTHILSDSVTNYAKEKNINSYEIEDFCENLGEGVCGKINNKFIKCGKYTFVQNDLNAIEKEREDDSMYVYISMDGSVLGRISFLDEVRPSMKNFIVKLKNMAPIVALVSGDKKKRAEKIANLVGIDIVESDCSPEDKVKIVEKYLKIHHGVVMVGDGINDAPALVRSDVGIVMSSGSNNVATSNGSMVITGDNPEVILQAINITKRTLYIAQQSIFVGLGLSIILMFCGAFKLYTPVQGALMQEIIDVIVIVNALRVRTIKN
ncbi:cadmium-translocating P-type ATPase [Candidatus Nomurabacteria bacterium]|nr:cadmium-translocating P-type ATPase [Candidatus Nomurabacteria bacterium]